MKKYRIVNKFRFYSLIMVLTIVLFTSMFFVVVDAKSKDVDILVSVYVTAGDTLWNLCDIYAGDNVEIREYINKVMDINNLDTANIHPGDVIIFPQSIE